MGPFLFVVRMTIVAYSMTDQVMAADSILTSSSIQDGHMKKIIRLPNGTLLGSSGMMDNRAVVKLLAKATARDLPTAKELTATETEYSGLLVFKNGKCFHIEIDHRKSGGWWAQMGECLGKKFYAVGSGRAFCLGALAGGASVTKAVYLTCQWVETCRPPVQVEPLKMTAKTAR